jgi:SAM-dependent methyltransferase
MDPLSFLNYNDECERYLEHNNDVHDTGYQSFVKPIVDAVTQRFAKDMLGLDFGSGTGPVVSMLLRDKGYSISEYDPFFNNQTELLTKSYDFIVCCEVIEHFHKPQKEFNQLKNMLNPGGELICMTNMFTEDINFDKWHYKNDPTHVIFYHALSIEYIAKAFEFSEFEIDDRLIIFRK